MTRRSKALLLASAILAAGAVPLFWLWGLRLPNEIADVLLHTAVGVVAVFYLAVVGPLADWIEVRLSRKD